MPQAIGYAKGGVQGQVGSPIVVQVSPQDRRLRLTGLLFETDKTFLLPLAAVGMKPVVGFFQANPGARVLVNGHTDSVGPRDYNRGLSSERAKSIRAFLLDDADDWTKRYKPQQISSAWGVREDQHMLTALGHYQGKTHGMLDGATVAAFKSFQGKSGLKADGLPGEKTRRALVLAYMKQEGTSLPPGTEVQTHGCGQTHPALDEGDQKDEQQNRRVEIFLFGRGIDPRPQALCPYNGCAEYAQWVKKAKDGPPAHHPGIHLDEFYARPAECDSRSEKPHMVTVPSGSEIILHWRSEGTDKIRLTALGVDGVPADVPGVDAAAQQISLKPDAVTIYTLYGDAGDDEVEFDRQVFVVPYAPEQGQTTSVVAGPDSLSVLDMEPAAKMDLAPPMDGDPPSGSGAISIGIHGGGTRNFQPAAPQSLGFKLRSDLAIGAHGGPRRPLLAQFALATAGFGAGAVGSSGDRTKAYQDLMAFGENATQWNNWAIKNVGNSSCGMYIRALWRLLGARDPDDWLAVLKQKNLYVSGQYQPNNTLVDPDYENGTVINGLKYFAQYFDAFTDVTATGLPAGPFARGDTFYITGAGGSQHIFSLVQDVGDDGIFYSVDGGQIAPGGSTIDDGPCCGIWPKKRGLTADRKNFTAPDKPDDPPSKWTVGRQVRWFIEFKKLRFTGPIIEPVRNTSEPKMLLR